MQLTRPAIDTNLLTERLEAMLRAGRSAAARPLLQALQRLQAPGARLAGLEARLLLAESKPADALAVLDRAITADPDDVGLLKQRVGVHVELGDIASATDDAAQAVILSPTDADAKKMLGVLLVTLDRAPDALACLIEALADDPRHASHYRGLALAQERVGALDQAASTLTLGISACPDDSSLREAALRLALHRRAFAEAVTLAEEARRDGSLSPRLFTGYGHALGALGRYGEAGDAYGEAAKLAPNDAGIRQFVMASGLYRIGAPQDQIRAMFEAQAAGFEAEMLAHGYRIPGLVRAAFEAFVPNDTRPDVLDLGCGTGMVAVAIADEAGAITGVDLSAGMLAAARERGCYAELVEADLTDWLTRTDRTWPVIVAADVLTYASDLEAIFHQVHQHLAPEGLFIFSLELKMPVPGSLIPADAAWALGRTGRHAHHGPYVQKALADAGFTLCRVTAEQQRVEDGLGVPGWLAVARRG